MLYLKVWVKSQDNMLSKLCYTIFFSLKHFEIPAPKLMFLLIDRFFLFSLNLFYTAKRILIDTPRFKSRCASIGKQFYLYGGVPFTAGAIKMTFGRRCRVSGQVTITGRTTNLYIPELQVGDNVDIGWMTTIAVGTKVKIGNNARIAGRSFFGGYPGHPLDAEKRAQGLPEEECQVGDIIICDDAWLATGVYVMAGVTIGQGSIIAAGSVVTKDIPDGVLAGGIPATVIKNL